MSRASKAYASAHVRTRVAAVKMFVGEVRRVEADMSAAIPAGGSIAKAAWELGAPYGAVMSVPTIEGLSTSVLLDAAYVGCSALCCIVTLNDGTALTQMFDLRILDNGLTPTQLTPGPSRVEVTA